MKTFEEIEQLKQDWSHDPCWDIESTEGFEEHKQELLEFRLKIEEEQDKKWQDKITSKANKLKCSTELAEYIINLEYRLFGHGY